MADLKETIYRKLFNVALTNIETVKVEDKSKPKYKTVYEEDKSNPKYKKLTIKPQIY